MENTTQTPESKTTAKREYPYTPFLCPFHDGELPCPRVLSPIRNSPTPKQARLLSVLGKPMTATKSGCTGCAVFREIWRKRMTLRASIGFLLTRFRQGGRPMAG